jgi:uncharacterized protein YjbI with pentapeptide repeats
MDIKAELIKYLIQSTPDDWNFAVAESMGKSVESLQEAMASNDGKNRFIADPMGIIGILKANGVELDAINLDDPGVVCITGKLLPGLDFSERVLTSIYLGACSMVNCTFTKAELNGGHISGCEIYDCNFDEAGMRGVSIVGTTIVDSEFRKSVMDAASFYESMIMDCDFSGVTKLASRIISTFTRGSDFTGCLISGKITQSVFSECMMDYVDFLDTQITDSIFTECSMREARCDGLVVRMGSLVNSEASQSIASAFESQRVYSQPSTVTWEEE